jgi:hypothetical protein
VGESEKSHFGGDNKVQGLSDAHYGKSEMEIVDML